jgi:3-oxoacyl-(acyl-carrier-protein) synthase
MSVYINGTAAFISQNTLNFNEFQKGLVEYETDFLKTVPVDYKPFMTPIEARRMSKIVKDSIVASETVLKQAGVTMPDAIICGTGLGIITDTEKFLEKMIEDNEQYLTPTSFIQSTHNTVAAQIALRLKCHNYNFTYVNRGHSFESALLDSIMMLREGKRNILVGGGDEMTTHYFSVTKKTGFWKQEIVKNTELFGTKTSGALCGEGVGFFVADSEKSLSTLAELVDLKLFYKPADIKEVFDTIKIFLADNITKISDIDLVILGNNGDWEQDKIYKTLQETIFEDVPQSYFKHLSGEYHTCGAFALWLASQIVSHKKYPEFIKANDLKTDKMNTVLIYNHYSNINHSLFLLKSI